jgi:hypothetical protein
VSTYFTCIKSTQNTNENFFELLYITNGREGVARLRTTVIQSIEITHCYYCYENNFWFGGYKKKGLLQLGIFFGKKIELSFIVS